MEGLPKGIDFVQVTETFLSIEGVVKVHSLRIWALSLDKIALSAHLAISKNIINYFDYLCIQIHAYILFFFLTEPGVNPQKILTTASKCIRSKYNFFEMTLQVEEFQDKMDHCFQCQMPEK